MAQVSPRPEGVQSCSTRGHPLWERRRRPVSGQCIWNRSTAAIATNGSPKSSHLSCQSFNQSQPQKSPRRKIKMNRQTHIAIYARVSSDQQAQQGTIDSQLAAVQKFAAENGLKVDPDLIFADNGVSASTLARPKLDALRDRAAAGEIDQVLLQVQGVIAEYEREKIVERSRRGKLHKAQAGKVCVLSGAPYGYVYLPATETEDARYEIHEREAEVVKQVFQLLVDQHLSIGAIARKLTQDRVPTRRDVGRWERSVIWAMLRNPAYTGHAAYRKTEAVDRARPTKQAYDRNFYPKHVH